MLEKAYKNYLILITYAILLYLGIKNIGAVLAFLSNVIKILMPFILGVLFAYVLNILMSFFERKMLCKLDNSKKHFLRKTKRPLAILLTFLTVILFFTGIMNFVVPQLSQNIATLARKIPDYIKSVEYYINDKIDALNLRGDFWNTVNQNWNEIINKTSQFISTAVTGIFILTVGLTNTIIDFFLSLIITIYILSAKEKLIRIIKKLIYAFLPERTSARILDIGSQANKTFQGFIAGQLTEALILGVLVFIGMLIFRFPYALLCSTIIAVTAIIPIFGAWIGIVLSAFIVFMAEPSKTLWFILFIVILQQIEGNLIYPRVVGSSIGLDGLWVLFGLVVGGSLFGIVGMLLGIPAFAVLYAIIRRVTDRRLKEKNIVV